MAEDKRVPLPAMLLGHDLLEGDVVFFAGKGWTRDPAGALVAQDEATAQRLEEEARRAVAANQVVGAYLVDVTLEPGAAPRPNHFRERFKTLGPSIRPDLGKQAEFTAAAGK